MAVQLWQHSFIVLVPGSSINLITREGWLAQDPNPGIQDGKLR